MAKQVQPLEIILGIKGAEKLAALKSSFRDLTKTVKQSDSDINAARKSINDYVRSANNSEAVIRGQIKAFEGLREQAAMGGKVYSDLSQDINKLQSTLRGSSDAVERKRESLVRLGAASRGSADEIRLVVGQLEKLKSKVREDSAAFSQLNKDISKLNATLKEIETSAGKAKFAINTILSAKPEKITGQIEKLSAAIASGTLEAEDLDAALRKLELLRVGAGRGPVAFRADVFSSELGVDYFARLRKEYDNLEKTQAAITQRISEVNTELRNVTGYERRRSLTLELIRLNKELQQSIVDVTTREQFQAMAIRQRAGRARETYAASGFGAFSAEIRQRTAGGEFTPGMQRARERARNEIVNEEAVKATTDIFSTWEQAYGRIEDAARGHKVEMARIQAAQGQLLIEKQDQINDQLLRSNQAAYDKEVAAFDARLDRIEKLKSGEYVSRQALGLGGGDLSSLYGNIVGIGTSYARGQQEMMGRSPVQVFNDITSTFNRDLRRSGDARIEAERQLRDTLVREFGAGSQKLKAALERIPVGKMTTSQLPGAGEDLSAYIKRIEASTRGLEGSLTGFGKKTTNELRQARQALVLFRDELDPTTASFKRLEKESIASIERIDKELERRQRSRRRMSPMQMTQAAGAAISGGIFGGPEGFLGGAIGAIGGVGSAFAGAAIGAQLGGLRRTLGGYADYAAQIERLKIALEGIAGPQEEYNRALAAANSVTEDLNVPQEVAIQGITRLTAAVKGAGGGVADAELAFKNINSAIIATGGGAEQVEGAVTALVQIFSKGKVSAEEINQIAERLPGTFNKIAAASGRTGPELTKALQDGKVGLNDLMKFLVSLGDEYGALALKIAASSENAGARLQIAYNNMRIEVGKALQPIGAEFQDAFAEFIKETTPALTDSAKAITLLLKSIMDSRDVIGPIVSLTAKMIALKLALTGLSALKAATVGFFAASAGGAKITGDAMVGLTAKMNGLTAAVKRLAVAFAALQAFEYLFKAFARGQELEVLTQRAESGAAAVELQGKSREEIIEAQNQAQQKFIELLKEEEQLKAKLSKANIFSVMFGTVGRTASDLQKVQLEMEGLYDVFGVKIPGADKPTNWKSPEEQAADEKKRATSLLNAIEQRENSIAQARIQLEEQAANIRKQAIEQARQLEQRFADQRLQKERQLQDLRRQLAYVEEDIALSVAESQFVAGGGDPEIARIRREAVEFERKQKEEEIELERQFLDEQTETSKAIEEFKSNNAKAIMEANEQHTKRMGEIQREYARNVAKIIEEGTGRAGERLELAGVIIANEIKKAEAQATALSLGYSFKRGGGPVGPSYDVLSDDERLALGAAREAFVNAEKAIDRAANSLVSIPTATAIAAPAIDRISMNFDNLTGSLEKNAAAFDKQNEKIKNLKQSFTGSEEVSRLVSAAANISTGLAGKRQQLERDQAISRGALRLREEGYSDGAARSLMEQELDTAQRLAQIQALRQEAESAAGSQEELARVGAAFDTIKQNVESSANAVRDLTIALDNIPTEIKLRTTIVDLQQQLRDLVDPANQIKGAATAIGDAFSQSFVDAISGATTAKQALADFFQSVGSYFLDMAKQIIAKMIQIAILNSVAKLLPSLGGGPNLTTSSGVSMSAGTATQSGFDMGSSLAGMFKANGGPVNANKPYIVGERGPELFVPNRSGTVIPNSSLNGQHGYPHSNTSAAMDRYRAGESRRTAQTVNVNYTVTEINGMRFVTEEEFRAGMDQAAKRGAKMGQNQTMSTLKNSRSQRSKIGL